MPFSLVQADPSTPGHLKLSEIRELAPDELDAINDAIRYCRAYARRLAVQLVFSGHASFEDALKKLAEPSTDDYHMFVTCREAEVALTSFLLLWRLFIDHARHDLSARFGKPSEQFDRFEDATHQAYDRYPGYRLVEGLRNYVQHVGLPGLHFSVNHRPGAAGEAPVVKEAEAVLPPDGLLAWNRCPALLRKDLAAATGPLPIVELVKAPG